MAYNESHLNPLDRIRFEVGDTNTEAELLSDATYTAVLARNNGDEVKATIAIARALVTKYAQEPDKIVLDGGKTESEWRNRLKAWGDLANRLQAEIDAVVSRRRPRGMHTSRATRFDGEGSGSEYRR